MKSSISWIKGFLISNEQRNIYIKMTDTIIESDTFVWLELHGSTVKLLTSDSGVAC